MSAWHVDEPAMRAYAARELEALQRASVETHVIGCGSCRSQLARVSNGSIGAVSFDDVWDRVQTRIESAPAARSTRWLGRLGIVESDRVVVRQVGRQSLQWTIATTFMLALAALAAGLGVHDSARLGFVLLAPLLPPLGVAATYRLTPTSTTSLETTSPYSPARLLLWRTGYALFTAVPAAIILGAVIPGNAWLSVAWLLPSAACTTIVLVAATWTDPLRPAISVSAAWLGLVVVWHVRHAPDAVASPLTQVVSLAVAVIAGGVLTRRLFVLRLPAI